MRKGKVDVTACGAVVGTDGEVGSLAGPTEGVGTVAQGSICSTPQEYRSGFPACRPDNAPNFGPDARSGRTQPRWPSRAPRPHSRALYGLAEIRFVVGLGLKPANDGVPRSPEARADRCEWLSRNGGRRSH